MTKFLIGLIRVYQRLLSPLLGNVCRFYPSCSRYAVACLETHGAARGSLLSFLRLCKCHPFHPGGVDLPPPRKEIGAATSAPTDSQKDVRVGAELSARESTDG